MYQMGYGVIKDNTEALKWYRKAAEQGNAYSQYNVGFMYENGYGVKKNIVTALEWYRKAAAQDHQYAKNKVLELSVNSPLTGFVNGHEYVDLGLPSGTLWATCNLGANKPEDYGNYYAWGETRTKSTYNWDSYKYANGSYNKMTKYCRKSDYGNNGFADNLTELEPDDDPATVNWGSSWHTPSFEQWNELLANTTNKWTKRKGVRGRLFTSKNNGQTLFLPAAGSRSHNELLNAGSFSFYWSSSLSSSEPDQAWHFYFRSDCFYLDDFPRYNGLSVRPVRQK